MSTRYIGGTVTMGNLTSSGASMQFAVHLDAGYFDYLQLLSTNLVGSLSANLVDVYLADPFGTIVDTVHMSAGQNVSYMPFVSGDYTLSFLSSQNTGTFTFTGGNAWVSLTNTTTGLHSNPFMTPYTGPVAGLSNAFIFPTTDNINITATSPNVFLHSGSGMDGLTALTGNNILDGGTGSNFLTGGAGHDTFYIDVRNLTANVWSTVVNFHAGDSATIWGITPQDHDILTLNGQGAPGFTGLTLIASAIGARPGSLAGALTIAGYTSADLSNGRLTTVFGRTQDLPGLPGSTYSTITAH